MTSRGSWWSRSWSMFAVRWVLPLALAAPAVALAADGPAETSEGAAAATPPMEVQAHEPQAGDDASHGAYEPGACQPARPISAASAANGAAAERDTAQSAYEPESVTPQPAVNAHPYTQSHYQLGAGHED